MQTRNASGNGTSDFEERDMTRTEANAPQHLPELLSTKQAAQVLNVSTRMVTDLCKEGRIKSIRMGKLWRINRDALFEFAGIA